MYMGQQKFNKYNMVKKKIIQLKNANFLVFLLINIFNSNKT